MGGACKTHGRDEKYTKNFGRKTEGKVNLKDLVIDEVVILKHTLNRQGVKAWAHLSQNRNQWTAFVDTVVKLHVP
jgi:hypothetical protein